MIEVLVITKAKDNNGNNLQYISVLNEKDPVAVLNGMITVSRQNPFLQLRWNDGRVVMIKSEDISIIDAKVIQEQQIMEPEILASDGDNG